MNYELHNLDRLMKRMEKKLEKVALAGNIEYLDKKILIIASREPKGYCDNFSFQTVVVPEEEAEKELNSLFKEGYEDFQAFPLSGEEMKITPIQGIKGYKIDKS